MADLLIKNAKIIDGTGAPSFIGNIAIENGLITAVTKDSQNSIKTKKTIDANGDIVTPGFIDIHTHYDGQVCWDKLVTPSSWHGVTTVIMGNCGVGFAPVKPGT